MKLAITTALALTTAAMAFAPLRQQRILAQQQTFTTTALFANKPFFAAAEEDASLEEEVEQLVQEEIVKTKRASNLRNANGVEYVSCTIPVFCRLDSLTLPTNIHSLTLNHLDTLLG
jgi:hypothetical protein